MGTYNYLKMKGSLVFVLFICGAACISAQEPPQNPNVFNIPDVFNTDFLDIAPGTQFINLFDGDTTTPIGILIESWEEITNTFLVTSLNQFASPLKNWLDFLGILFEQHPSLREQVTELFNLFVDRTRDGAVLMVTLPLPCFPSFSTPGEI